MFLLFFHSVGKNNPNWLFFSEGLKPPTSIFDLVVSVCVCVCFFFFLCVCFVFVCVCLFCVCLCLCVYPPAPMVVLNMFLPCCLRDELRCSHQQSIEVTAGSSTHLQVRILTLEFDPSFVVCEGPLTARNRPDPFLSEESTYLVNGKGTPGYPTVQKGTLQIPWPHYNAKKIPQSQ